MPIEHGTILRLVNTRLSLPLVYASCHDILRQYMPSDNMFVCIQESAGLRFPYFVDELQPEDTMEIFPKEGWTAYVIDTGQRLWLSRDLAPPADITPVGPMASDWFGYPLKDRDGHVLGVMAVQTYEPGLVYTDDDSIILEFMAEAISLAIQLARQDRELAIRRIAALVDEVIDVEDLYPQIHQIMQEIIPAARKNLIIARVDEEAGIFRPVFWCDEKDDFDTMLWPLDRGFSAYICKVTGRSYIHEDGRTPMPAAVQPIGTPPMYWLGCPLYSKDRIIGVVVIQSYERTDIITKEDEFALNDICPHIASAISHAELFSLRLQRV
jgi:hypothetical protein